MMQLPIKTSLLQPGDRVLVAVSGGADSLALLHALATRRDELCLWVVAAHVHHGMRGDAADADVEYLRAQCAQWEVPLAVEYADVPALAAARGISVEEAGRDARYGAFGRLAGAWGCGKVATAHHADDQVETVLLNLFRGAGIDGLAGMPERRRLTAQHGALELIRPLLALRRAELEAYCAAHALEPRWDVTNEDLAYRRNRVRQHLLPLLAEYDPAIARHLLRLADQAREEQELLQAAVEQALAGALIEEPASEWPIPMPPPPPALTLRREILLQTPPALRRRVLRTALRRIAGYALELDAALVERIQGLLSETGPAALDLPGCHFEARRVGDRLLLRSLAQQRVPEPEPVEFPGTTSLPSFGIRLEVEPAPPPDNVRLPPAEAILDAGSLREPLVLRTAGVGERFRALHAPGRRLLSDFYADRGVPAHYRPVWPVLADADGPVWVLGLGIAHRARVTPETRRAVRLRVSGMGPSGDQPPAPTPFGMPDVCPLVSRRPESG